MPVISDSEQKEILGLIYGDRARWFEYWKNARAKDGATITQNQFVHKNVLRKVAKLWVNLMPLFEVSLNQPEAPGQERTKDAKGRPVPTKLETDFEQWKEEFFSRKGWEGQLDFWASLPFFRLLIFATGNWIMKLPTTKDAPDKVKPTRIRSGNIQVIGDGRTVKGVAGYRFRYNMQSDTTFTTSTATGVFVEETIQVIKDENGKISGVAWTKTSGPTEASLDTPKPDQVKKMNVPADVDFLPMVHVAYEPQEDSVFGYPMGKHVLDICLDLCSVATDIRRANKKTAKPQLVLVNTTGENVDPDQALEIHDTDLKKADAKLLGGGLALTSLEAEAEELKKDAYEQASVPYPGKDEMAHAPSGSGKAQIVLSAPSAAELSNYEKIEGQGIAEMLTKGWNIEHPGQAIQQEWVTVTYDPMDSPDPDQELKRAEFFNLAGYKREALRQMGKDEDAIDQIELERADDKADAQDEFMNRDPSAPKPGEPGYVEPELDAAGKPIKKVPPVDGAK